jgi:UDP-N-acetylmuramate dehydrogenase
MNNIDLKENVAMSEFSGIKVGGKAAYISQIKSVQDLIKANNIAKEKGVRLIPIGAGTNTFFGSGKLNILGLENKLLGKEVTDETDDSVEVAVQSGEDWDDIVSWTVDNGWAGIEALSAIPGTVGAAPVQNIGAYGQEVSQTITSVEALDLESNVLKSFNNSELNFSYRNSIFKTNPGQYFIVKVNLRLSRNYQPEIPNYESAKQYFTDLGIIKPTLQQIRDNITNLRWSKLPRPEVLPNCGSWFKNPIINYKIFEKIKVKYLEVKSWEVGEDEVKLSAGWLVDQTVGKDYEDKYFATYGKNALIIVNHSLSTSTKKLLKFEQEIVDKVNSKFGVKLEREPILIE